MTDTTPQTGSPTDSTAATLVSRIAPAYWIRAVLVGLMCLVFGIWGLYDYLIGIPLQEEMHQRLTLTEDVKRGLDPGTNPNDPSWNDLPLALERVNSALSIASSSDHEKAGNSSSDPMSEATWQNTLKDWQDGLQALTINRGARNPAVQQAGMQVETSMKLYGDVQPPSSYDRPVQWLFILSLIFVPYYAWGLIKHVPRIHRLHEDGTIHLPEGKFRPEEIQDINMSRWMAKSTAELVLVDGRRIMLDAYIHKNLHLIIGSIAHRLHPEDWEEDGKQVKPVTNETAGSDDEDGEDASTSTTAPTSHGSA